MKRWIVLVGLITGFAGAVVAGAEEEPERAPAIDRCREFCARIYGESGGEYDECAVACGDADVCHRDCKQKFGGDQAKVRNCLRACMRRNEKPVGEAPVEL
jgi:hypothetical protein